VTLNSVKERGSHRAYALNSHLFLLVTSHPSLVTDEWSSGLMESPERRFATGTTVVNKGASGYIHLDRSFA